MQIQMMKLSEIHPYEKNPRFNDGAVEAVANSIKEFGFQQPIVVDKDLVVVVGHTRLKAAEQLGLTEVPVVIAENLTPEQVQAYRIADNKTGEIAEWNYDLLPIELRDLQEKDFDLSLLGFDTDELDRLLNGSSEENVVAEGETDADAVPDVPEEPVSQPGVIYQLGKHRLMCGDSTRAEDVARLMNGGKADLVFTDPPYGVSYRGVNNPGGRLWEVIENDDLRGEKLSEFLLAAFKNLKASLREKRAFYIWYASSNHLQFEHAIIDAGLKSKQVLFWNKGMILGHSDYHWAAEPCFYGCHEGELRVVRRPLPDDGLGHQAGRHAGICASDAETDRSGDQGDFQLFKSGRDCAGSVWWIGQHADCLRADKPRQLHDGVRFEICGCDPPSLGGVRPWRGL